MLLHLLRHADAGDPNAWQGPDAIRPLSAKGRRQSKRLGDHLAAIGFATDAIVTSPKVRAEQTADLVGERLDASVTVDDRLGGGFDLEIPEDLRVYASDPTDSQGNILNNGWRVMVRNEGRTARQATAIAVCAKAH